VRAWLVAAPPDSDGQMLAITWLTPPGLGNRLGMLCEVYLRREPPAIVLAALSQMRSGR
jgi:hypothetical protein